MSYAAMLALRARFKADAALSAWSTEHFGRVPSFYIGLKRASAAKLDELPVISFVRARATIKPHGESAGLSIMLGLHSKDVVDGVFIGLQRMDEMERLIVNALEPYRLDIPGKNAVIDSSLAGFGDMGIQHPYYESEIQIVVNIRS